MLSTIFALPRWSKRVITVAFDVVALLSAFYLAIVLRYSDLSITVTQTQGQIILLTALITVAVFIKLGLYRAVIRYLGYRALRAVFIGAAFSAITLFALDALLNAGLPRSVFVIYWAVASLYCGLPRMFVRALVYANSNSSKERVIIYGAGSSGRQLASSLNHGSEYRPIAFIDDKADLQGKTVLDTFVYEADAISSLIETHLVRKVLLAMPSCSRSRRKEVIEFLEQFPVEVLSIPGSADLVAGATNIDQFHEVAIEDLLGRDSVTPQPELMESNIRDKIVMVTGAGGSIGSEMCRQALAIAPKKLVLFELSEFALYSIHRELEELKVGLGVDVEIVPLMGNVQYRDRLISIMKAFEVETIYHAAAYKHVPIVEHNVAEGVCNNVFGTWHTAEAAIEAGVDTFVLISTDKAVRPTNVMGTTKRLAELVLQALAKRQSSTRFCMVRFGNVLGSSGSVVPLFRKQIQAGGPVTLTHKDITRYFMTIPEAAQLVIQAGAMGKGGDVFVLDMGEPVKIIDLAERMIRLSGLTVKSESEPSGDIEIVLSGLRPGEKLYEELLIGDDNVKPTSHERIMTATEVSMSWNEVQALLSDMKTATQEFDQARIRELLLSAPTGFVPKDGICDLVWAELPNLDQSGQFNTKTAS
ncbi:polysaccharide biosynthesis protein [Nitrincola sp.]|uniref:polysaccharide biosynthesis protein n=1 Tax=Nitrincola sp. TaxID=1926584 RepID=UPI003A91389D